jgi:predicted CopG family antitoxin
VATKTVRLDEDVYEMLAERKREDETFSEAVERLVGGRPLVELAGVYTEDEVREIERSLDEKYEREREQRISETQRR